jgi:hypothetical protein
MAPASLKAAFFPYHSSPMSHRSSLHSRQQHCFVPGPQDASVLHADCMTEMPCAVGT